MLSASSTRGSDEARSKRKEAWPPAGGARKMERSCESARIRLRTPSDSPGASHGNMTTRLGPTAWSPAVEPPASSSGLKSLEPSCFALSSALSGCTS